MSRVTTGHCQHCALWIRSVSSSEGVLCQCSLLSVVIQTWSKDNILTMEELLKVKFKNIQPVNKTIKIMNITH